MISIIAAFAAFAAGECHANLNGSDNFNDNSKDSNRWGADFVVSGVGVFTETSQHLEYTTSGTVTPSDITARPWILNTGSSSEDWEVRVDVNVPQFSLASGQQVFLGLIVYAGNPLANRFLIELGQGDPQPELGRKFRSFFYANSVGFPNVFTQTSTTSAAVRIAFDANSKVLSCYYDENGQQCGYSWTLLRSEEVGVRWGLTNGSAISVAVVGDCSLTALSSSNNVFADNFSPSSGAMPKLGIALDAGELVVSWPTNAPECHLESATSLTPAICWQIATTSTGIVRTNFTVTNSLSSPQEFYRLSR